MSTKLTQVVLTQTGTSVLTTITRTVDTLAEEMAREILRDPEFRDEMHQLVRAAFRQTLKELNEPAPISPTT